MKTSDQYEPKLAFGLLLVGPPKTGKTTLAMQFPNVWVADCDNNLASAIRQLQAMKRLKPFKFDYIHTYDDGKMVPLELRWERLVELSKLAAADPWVKTIVVDSASMMCDSLIQHVLETKDDDKEKARMTINDWVPYRTLLTKYITTFRSVGKLLVVTCHEMSEKDEMTGSLVYKPAIPSKLQDSIGGFFSDVWLTQVSEVAGKLSYEVRAAPTARRQQLGNSLLLPADFVFDWDAMATRLDKSLDIPKFES